MATINTPHLSRRVSFPRKGLASEQDSKLETRILKLEQMCQSLQQRPRVKSGIAPEELIDILMAERSRLKATMKDE